MTFSSPTLGKHQAPESEHMNMVSAGVKINLAIDILLVAS